MGCATSVYASVGKKKRIVQESVVFVLQLRVPVQSDLQRQLKGVAPKTTVERLACLRNQIQLVAEDTGGSAISELRTALEEYLSLLTGIVKKKNDGMEGCVEFKWKILGDGRRAELCFTNIWMEMLTVIHMMAALALTEANSLMIPKACSDSSNSVRVVSSDCRRDAVDLLLKASGYLEFCIREILTRFPPDIKSKLPDDMQESVLQTLSIQALGQGTEIQLGLAVDSQKATLRQSSQNVSLPDYLSLQDVPVQTQKATNLGVVDHHHAPPSSILDEDDAAFVCPNFYPNVNQPPQGSVTATGWSGSTWIVPANQQTTMMVGTSIRIRTRLVTTTRLEFPLASGYIEDEPQLDLSLHL
ncbi:hypothetical protein DY000_02000558 [Brassica cretica]|uniref:BRO1 domain-containing protein n=1 Tax=Brassica cretica TaxID=69181 RepID=A0ABQ7CJY5_BRACR|nr:hypothetical protein DY000_02000558 [Brassica cretica]